MCAGKRVANKDALEVLFLSHMLCQIRDTCVDEFKGPSEALVELYPYTYEHDWFTYLPRTCLLIFSTSIAASVHIQHHPSSIVVTGRIAAVVDYSPCYELQCINILYMLLVA
ncbi:hypothetical protein VC83_05765 [Pseudogymnoascus destructans]|uniref:Uncharacterized protein n=1 Tax=Pseudogymnoascus destructans TaxID=655981 RepID=A0A177A6J9_9PEZI|nr:uncharacterized protein VC83_05765 [Pseudogymnoascus destructans]OAF57789.1 hypothetical protein VC83_05765 [Pseudogymnoascus destructans]